MKHIRALSVLLLSAIPAHAANIYVGQTAQGAANGTSQTDRWSYSTLAALNWSATFGPADTICIVGTVTSAFIVKPHNSSTMLTIDGSCDGTVNLGEIVTAAASTGAITINGAGTEHTTIQNIIVRNTGLGGSGIRLVGDVAPITDVRILGVTSNDSAADGLNFKCVAAAAYNDVAIRDSSFDNNGQQGMECAVDALAPGVFVEFNRLETTRTHWNNNADEGVRLYDTTGNAQVDSTCNIRIRGWTARTIEASRNGQHGLRIGNSGHCHINGNLNWLGIIANDNGDDPARAGGGGILLSGFGSAGRTRVQVLASASDGPNGGNAACYFGGVTANRNDGPNSGVNWFASNGCLIENTQTNDNTLANICPVHASDGGPAGCTTVRDIRSPIIDGNGFIFDEESDETVGQFMESSGNHGTAFTEAAGLTSGAGIMVLRRADNLTLRHLWGADNKIGIHLSGPQTGLEIYDAVFVGNRIRGVEHTATSIVANITVRDSIFTASGVGSVANGGCAGACTVGFANAQTGDSLSSGNTFFGFDIPYVNQAAGAGDSTVNPALIGGALTREFNSLTGQRTNYLVPSDFEGSLIPRAPVLDAPIP